MRQICMFCNQKVDLVYVHGHYQCPKCGINALPCCDGDNCEDNQLWANNLVNKDTEQTHSKGSN